LSSKRVVAAVALGSNLGEREKNMAGAVRSLERTDGVTVLRRSHWIETASVGGPEDAPDFLNGVVLVETTLEPRALLGELQRIETKYGRDRTREERNGPRSLDLDLLYHGDTAVQQDDLTLPHPRMEERAFVLEPLAEVAPDHVLAVCGETVAERVRQMSEQEARP